MKKRFLPLFVLGMLSGTASAQRATDVLDRGLVAVQVKADSRKLNTEGGIFCSWRMPAEEYYDVKYNIYRDGTKLNSEPSTPKLFGQKRIHPPAIRCRRLYAAYRSRCRTP